MIPSGFSFSSLSSGTTTASSSSSTTPFTFTTSASTPSTSTSSGGFSFTGFGTPTTTSTATTPVSTPAPSSFSFNISTPTTTSASTGFSSFNLSTSTVTPTLGVKPISTTGVGSTTTASTFSFGLPASSTTLTGATTTVPAFGPSSPTAPSVALPAAKDGAAAGIVPPVSSASLTVSGPSTTAPSLFGTSAALTTATTTTSSSTSGGALGSTNLSMRPLEERLNKWLVELKEQEERFVRQAAHVNAWDQILQNGHDQVQSLKDTLHTVKSDQSRLEAEIDFIRGQQEELERLLEPLELATASNPAPQLHQGDRQRDNMYYLAQSLDAQLRQMTDDLGKVIEHLNTNAKPWQPYDPVALVARILSAHMDTLKWVDQNTALLTQKMEEVARVAATAGKRG